MRVVGTSFIDGLTSTLAFFPQVIRNMQDSVIQGLEGIQNSTAKVLQEQEKDLMRSFRARLQDLTKELETQKAAKGNYSAELQAR